MANPLVSLVIPCFNQGRYLQRAIESCLAQTYPHVEIIVVNDGSTDETAAVMEATAARSERIRGVTMANAGLGAARNRGCAAATGEYLNVLDADDWLEPSKIERQLSILESTPAVGLVLCDIQMVDERGDPLRDGSGIQLHRFHDPDNLFDVLLETGLFPPHVPLVRKTLVDHAGGFCEDRDVAGHADYLLWLSIAASGLRIHVLDEQLAVYRRAASSMSTDLLHMDTSRRRALAIVAQQWPDRVAQGIVALGRQLDDLRFANDVLSQPEHTAQQSSPELVAELRRLQFVESILRDRDPARPLWIWGSGEKGRQVIAWLSRVKRDVNAVIDSDPAKWGAVVDGVPVVSPQHAAECSPQPQVIIASIFHEEIAAKLASLGITDHATAP